MSDLLQRLASDFAIGVLLTAILLLGAIVYVLLLINGMVNFP